MPKISIIIPIYNVEKYLKRCVDSILRQTYSNLEIILVDDGSPDNCGLMCDEYAKLDKRIKVIHKQNGGLSSARNAGLDVASGDYIGFVDSDDWIHPKMYEILYKSIIKSDVGMVNCGFKKVSEKDEINDEYFDDNQNVTVLDKAEIFNDFFNKYYYDIFPIVCNKLYKKKIFDRLRFKTGRINEDEFIILPSIDLAGKVGIINCEFYYYFFSREGSIMNTAFTPRKLDSLYAIYYKFNFFKTKGISSQTQKYVKKYFYECLNYYDLILNNYPMYLKDFSKYLKKNIKFSFSDILNNTLLCKMEKIIFITFYFNKRLSLKLFKKYFY